MKASGHVVLLLVVVCSVLLFSCTSYEVVETTEQIVESSLFRQYLNSSVFLQPLGEFLQDYAKQQDQELGLKSPGQHTFTGLEAYIEKPVKFAPGAKHPSEGVWFMRAYEGAGTATRKYNVWCIAAKGKRGAPSIADGVMGDTICTLELQHDVIRVVFLAVREKTGVELNADRPPIITDTKIADLSKLDTSKGLGSWTEEWIVVLGDETFAFEVEFTRVYPTKTDFVVRLY